MAKWTVEPGRNIHFDGQPFVHIDREREALPVEADELTQFIVEALNSAGVTPDELYKKRMGVLPRQGQRKHLREPGRVVRAPARLDAFTRQYMETALWSSTDNSRDDGGDPLDDNYGIDDIAPETRDKMIVDCTDFQERFGNLYDDSGQAGHDFWLSRNGHGTGFFDRDTPNADKLQEAAESYGEFYLDVGDDGMIYGS